MRRVTAMVSAAAVVLWMATAFAQGLNFSGTWTRDAPAGAPAGGGGGGGQRGGGMGGGGKWVVTRTIDMQGTSITNTQTISIEGGKLTIVTTSTREGAAPQTVTYTKKS